MDTVPGPKRSSSGRSRSGSVRRSRRPPPGGASRLVRALPAFWCGAALVGASLAIGELASASAPSWVRAQEDAGATAGGSDRSIAAALLTADSSGLRPSNELANGMTLARAAARLPQGERRRLLLDKAVVQFQHASSGRPFWGEAWTMRAYANSLRDGADAPLTRSSFAMGYRLSPYLIGAAPWRIDFGFSHWESLDPATRAAVIREAVWYSRRGAYERDAVFARARGNSPSAYRAFMELWINSRVGDAAFVPLKGQTPQ